MTKIALPDPGRPPAPWVQPRIWMLQDIIPDLTAAEIVGALSEVLDPKSLGEIHDLLVDAIYAT